MHPDGNPHPYAGIVPPGDTLPETEEFTPEQLSAMYAAYVGAVREDDLPTAGEVAAEFGRLGEEDPFLGK